jgi:hypothetical protein
MCPAKQSRSSSSPMAFEQLTVTIDVPGPYYA